MKNIIKKNNINKNEKSIIKDNKKIFDNKIKYLNVFNIFLAILHL